jgi:hypothetical protein
MFSSSLCDDSRDPLALLAEGNPLEPMIHVTLDDVGNCGKDGMAAVVGYVAYKEQWEAFNWAWKKTLADFGLEYLHTSNYIYRYPRVGDHPPTDEELFKILDPWIDIVYLYLLKPGTGLGICVIVPCADYEQLTAKEKQFVREPALTAFELAVGFACWHVKGDLSALNGMAVQMDETQNACSLYERYQFLKNENQTLKKYLSAIAFTDDKRHWPVQAADMLGHLTLRTWRQYQADPTREWPGAFTKLVFPEGSRTVASRVFGLDRLRRLARLRMELQDKAAIPDDKAL